MWVHVSEVRSRRVGGTLWSEAMVIQSHGPDMRYNTQHHHSSVYYAPKGDATTNQLPTMLSLITVA